MFAQPFTKLIIKKFEVESDDSIVNVTTRFDLLPNDAYELNVHADLFVELQDFLVRIGVSMEATDGTFGKPIISFVNVCKYFKNNNGNMLVRMFYNAKSRSKKLPTSCPIAAGHYFFEGFDIYDEFLKLNVLETKFLVVVDICTKEGKKLKCFAQTKTFGEIRERKKWEKEMAAKAIKT